MLKKALLLISMQLLIIGHLRAQELEPRTYVNVPIDQNFVYVAYSYSAGDVNVAPSIPLENASVSIHASVFSYIRTLDIAGNSAKFDVMLPYVCATGSAMQNGQRLSRKVCGQGDSRVRVNYNFYGAPALALQDFMKQKKDVVVGASLQLSVPTGQYDADKLVNIGANRWFIKPEIGASFPWRNWSVELAAGVKIFTDNNAFFGGVRLQQDPIYNLQAHFVYDLSPGQWLSFNSNYFFGGTTYKNGVQSPDRQKNSRVGVTYLVALDRQHGLKLFANTGVVTRIGNDSDSFGILWLYRWQ